MPCRYVAAHKSLSMATDKELFLTVTDVDECAEQNGECSQNCTNNVGNHTCSCFGGYTDVYDNGTLCTGTLVNIVRG